MTGTEPSTGRSGKVEKLLEKYDLPTLGDEISARWAGENDDERLGLRPLARIFNIKILEAALDDAEAETIGGEPEYYYDNLTSEDISSGIRTNTKKSLERMGVDTDELLSDFVSRQAIHTYLNKTRNVSRHEPSSEPETETISTTIERLRQRTARVTESKVDRLRERGDLDVGSFRVIVDVQVYCSDCGRQYSASNLIDRGRCDCVD